MTCRPKRRHPRRGKTLRSRRTTPIENGISGSCCANESLPNVVLLGGRINARRALRLLLKNLNAKRLYREEQRNEARHRRNAVTGENTD